MNDITGRQVLVTGDLSIDWRFGQSQMIDRRGQMFDPEYYIEPYIAAGGAALLGNIIRTTIATAARPHGVLAPDTQAVLDHDKRQPYWHSYSVCCQYPPSERPGDEDGDPVWRVAKKLGINRIDLNARPDPLNGNDIGEAHLVVVDDAQQWFVKQRACWPRSLNTPAEGAWLLLKWSRPEFYKADTLALWTHAIAAFGGRVAVIVTAEDLRLMGMRISRSLSWERTIEDLDREVRDTWLGKDHITQPPYGCTHLIVSFVHAGAVLYSMMNGTLEARILYDPAHIEGDWQRIYAGSMVGYTRCLTAGVALGMLEAPSLGTIDSTSIKAGIVAARCLLSGGFEVSVDSTPRDDTALPRLLAFPTSSTARVLRTLLGLKPAAAPPAPVEERFAGPDAAALEMAAAFRERPIPSDLRTRTWKMVDDYLCADTSGVTVAAAAPVPPPPSSEPSLPPLTPADRANLREARKIVEYGSDKLPRSYPFARFGKVVVTDRSEVESLHAISELLENYLESATGGAPLSIAVFGPPGAGKSFTITELAEELSNNRTLRVRALVFNLSQFTAPNEISNALQQVRDVGLSGEMPLVFWDEFDTDFQRHPLGWLRYFLAPMQDGRFQEGPITHKIGRAIFVFAGGTSSDMNAFLAAGGMGPNPNPSVKTEGVKMKVPDFVSRLKGFVNVPPLNYSDDRLDSAVALRRAELLRAFLLKAAGDLVQFVPDHVGSKTPAGDTAVPPPAPSALSETNGGRMKLRRRLNVDRGVINAFIRIREYRHSARSMEAIVKMSALSGKRMFDRASLPPREQLDLHVAAEAFLQIVDQSWAEPENAQI